MAKSRLNPKLFDYLKKKTKGKMKEGSIRPALSRIRRKYPSLTLNASAEVFAQQRDFSVSRYLTDEDRRSLSVIKIEKVPVTTTRSKSKQKMTIIADYETDSKWLRKHIEEINKTYTYRCYTACFVLCRKVMENLIVHNIVKKKYPTRKKEHREIYYDFNKKRHLDFSIIIKNLRNLSGDFGPEKKLVERICQLVDGFKDDANEMTHSLYHIARKKEIDDNSIQDILDLIKELENSLST